MSQPATSYQSEAEIRAVVDGFEACTIPPSEFDHRAHVTVAFAYLQLDGRTVPEATRRMREKLFRFINHNGVDPTKYNETTTLFWIRLVRRAIDRENPSATIADLANAVVGACDDSQLIYRYFSKERLGSENARAGWVEPDLQALDF